LIECKTYRWEGHVVGEEAFLGKRAYRSQDEIAAWKQRCPLVSFETRFTANGMFTQAELDAVKAEVKREIEEAVTFAMESPLPKPEEALEDMFSAA
jgi:pyruvate dehydrogenase E1 component alpha subunit